MENRDGAWETGRIRKSRIRKKSKGNMDEKEEIIVIAQTTFLACVKKKNIVVKFSCLNFWCEKFMT